MNTETRTEFLERAKSAARHAMAEISDNSINYSIGTRGTGGGFEVIALERPESQQKERQRRKELGKRLW